MKKFLLPLLLLSGPIASACTTCNQDLQRAIFDSTFYPNLFTMLSAFLVLAVIVAILIYLTSLHERKRNLSGGKLTVVPLISASTTLGIGMGGLIDGTVLHQILQWHEMLSNKIPPVTLMNKSVNMFWDGIFHFFCWIVILIGIFLLTKLFFRTDVIVTWKTFIGGLFLGWGLFNIVEGIIDHQILKLHNVREITGDVEFWNYGFLGVSVVLVVFGFVLIGRGMPEEGGRRQEA